MAFPASPAPSSANLARQKTFMINRNPGVFYALKALFLHLAANRGNPDLYFKNIDGLVNASDGGNSNDQVIVDGPCTVYAIYIKKTGSTAAFFKATNHAATAQTNGTQDLGYKMTTSGEENLWLFPNGHALSTGLVVSSNTTATGATASLQADRIDGFAIVSA
jgi:hypothetical protein